MMKTLLIVVLILAYPGLASGQDDSSVAAQLNALCANDVELAETLVRPASLLIQEHYLNKPWDDVRAELLKQGLSITEGRRSQYITRYEVPVAANVVHVRDISFDLVLTFDVDNRKNEDVPTARHNHVLTAKALLRAPVGIPTADVIASDVFPLDSVLGRALSSPVRQERDGGYTVLKRIEMSYDVIRHHRESEWPFGYYLSLYFGQPSDEQWRNRISLTVLSTDDPPRDRDYNVVKDWQGWKWTLLEEIQFWGSTEVR